MRNSEIKGEIFYKQYKTFIDELNISDIRNIISNNPRNFMTIYFRMRGLLKNTKIKKNIPFDEFLDIKNKKDNDFHREEFNKTLSEFLKDKENLLKQLTNFFQKNLNSFIPSRTDDKFYFHHYQDKECYNTIMEKFFKSDFMKHIQEFINEMKDKHKEVLSKYFNYMHAEEENINKIDRRLVEGFNRNEYFKLMGISDFFYAGYLSELKEKMTPEELNALEDMKNYYLMTVRASHFDGDVIELFSSKIFEEILREIKGYIKKFKEIKKEENNIKKIKGIIKDIKKKLLLISSHDSYLSSHLYFLGINGNNYDYDYNDDISLILHFDEKENELYLETKYNGERVVAEYCQKDSKRNICEFESYLYFIEKRIHSQEMMQKYCSGEIQTFPAYQDRVFHIKDDL